MLDSLEFFKEITKVPRPSKKEEQIAKWLINKATTLGYQTKQDEAGNLLITVAGKGSGVNKKTVVIQAHMDMVCEKNDDIKIDFLKDGITTYEEDGYLKAKGTTLGADNGVGIALGFYCASLDNHPPLELLCTSDEESGMSGAKNMKAGFFTGKRLLNIDGHTDNEFTVGCAGGNASFLTFKAQYDESYPNGLVYSFKIDGFTGGHSGLDIGLDRKSAVVEMIKQLKIWLDNNVDFRLAVFNGGTAHNAIARSSEALIVFKDENASKQAISLLVSENSSNTNLKLEADCEVHSPLSMSFTKKIIDTLASLKHGVHAWSKIYDGFVETSANIASVKTTLDDTLEVCYSYRSFIDSKIFDIKAEVEKLASGDLTVRSEEPYPAWTPTKNAITDKLVAVYKDVIGKDPIVAPVHAGLECGYWAKLVNGIEIISMGANIHDLHAPTERLEIKSLKQCEVLLKNLMEQID